MREMRGGAGSARYEQTKLCTQAQETRCTGCACDVDACASTRKRCAHTRSWFWCLWTSPVVCSTVIYFVQVCGKSEKQFAYAKVLNKITYIKFIHIHIHFTSHISSVSFIDIISYKVEQVSLMAVCVSLRRGKFCLGVHVRHLIDSSRSKKNKINKYLRTALSNFKHNSLSRAETGSLQAGGCVSLFYIGSLNIVYWEGLSMESACQVATKTWSMLKMQNRNKEWIMKRWSTFSWRQAIYLYQCVLQTHYHKHITGCTTHYTALWQNRESGSNSVFCNTTPTISCADCHNDAHLTGLVRGSHGTPHPPVDSLMLFYQVGCRLWTQSLGGLYSVGHPLLNLSEHGRSPPSSAWASSRALTSQGGIDTPGIHLGDRWLGILPARQIHSL